MKIFFLLLSTMLYANDFSSKIDDTTEVEKDIEKVDKQINERLIVDTTLVAYVLAQKSKQTFSLSKQKSLLSITTERAGGDK